MRACEPGAGTPIRLLRPWHRRWSAALAFACVPAAFAADGPPRPVRDVRVEFVRPFGLPAFEDPASHLATLESAARDCRVALGDTPDPALAPLAVRFLGDHLVAASAVVAPAGVEPPPPLEIDPLSMRQRGARGAYASVLRECAARARASIGGADRSIARDEAVLRFADTLEAAIGERSDLGGLSVTLGESGGVLVAPEASGSAARTLVLPAIAEFDAIDGDAIASLARQIETSLERDLAVAGPDGSPARLDFRVSAVPPDGPSDTTLRFRVAFVGPAGQPSVPVSGFSLVYLDGAGEPIADPAALGLPDPADVIRSTTVSLFASSAESGSFLTDDGLAADAVAYSLAGDAPRRPLSVSALRVAVEGVLETLRSRDLMGIFVDVAGGQFDMARGGIDVRGTATDVVLVAIPGIVDRVRVVASGERIGESSPIDPPDRRYRRIAERSPVGPGAAGGRLLRQTELEEYLDRLSRHPNRRVDAAVTPPPVPSTGDAPKDGAPAPTIGLDYLVSENRPWTVFVQGSNTGTGATGEWQQRFGVFHSDLFGNDEIVSVDYLTTDFDAMHAVNAYFDAPILESERLRWKVYGGWYEYTASDVGLGTERFEGSSPSVGAEVSCTIFQSGKLFVDAVVGARWFDVTVNNLAINLRGEQDFLVPYLGVRLQRNTRAATTDASLFLDIGAPDATDVDAIELNALGRLFPDRDWSLLRWDIAQSFYLDPLFVRDASDGTLAHELSFRFRGQTSFDARLIPQQLGVAGGLYTVRGYPESIVSGDRLLLATGEYRLHLPQVLGFDANPQPLFGVGEPFRLRPQFGYGSTDWDLILRAFIDVGRVENVDRLSFERDDTLVGAGLGVELQVLRHLNLRLDWGFPLNDLEGREIDDSRLTFVGTLAF